MSQRRSYVGSPRVYLTYGVHEDGNWKRRWFVFSSARESRHFETWRDAINYALSIPMPAHPQRRRRRALISETVEAPHE